MGIVRAFVFTAAIVALGGCSSFVPGGVTLAYYKPNTTRAQRTLDADECQFQSVKEIPAAMQVDTMPGYSSPGSLICNGTGSYMTCNQVGAVDIQPTVYSVDQNAGIRARYVDYCLKKRGYALVERHYCQSIDDHTTEDCVVPRE